MSSDTNVLVVSGFSGLYDTLAPMLKDCGFCEVFRAVNTAAAKKILLTEEVCGVVINCPLDDGFGLDFAMECATQKNTAVLMFVKKELFSQCVQKTASTGILTLKKPNTPETVRQSLHLLFSTSKKLTCLRDNDTEENERTRELKLISRAKMILISSFGMTEEQAHKYIERRSMESRLPKKTVALNIINSYGV